MIFSKWWNIKNKNAGSYILPLGWYFISVYFIWSISFVLIYRNVVTSFEQSAKVIFSLVCNVKYPHKATLQSPLKKTTCCLLKGPSLDIKLGGLQNTFYWIEPIMLLWRLKNFSLFIISAFWEFCAIFKQFVWLGELFELFKLFQLLEKFEQFKQFKLF